MHSMKPVLFHIGAVPVTAYAAFVALAFVAAWAVRRAEKARLGFDRDPRQRYVGLGALLGAVLGAKLGMLLFTPPTHLWETLQQALSFDFTGKTVVGALIGGYVGVEIAKKWVGIRHSTGDAYAVALPLGQAIGRLGCFFNGCCYGTPSDVPWATFVHGALRHPVPLYESALDLTLAAALWWTRHDPRPQGHLFRRYLVGYATIRFVTEFWRGDPEVTLGPLSLVQWVCLVAACGFAALIVRGERASTQ